MLLLFDRHRGSKKGGNFTFSLIISRYIGFWAMTLLYILDLCIPAWNIDTKVYIMTFWVIKINICRHTPVINVRADTRGHSRQCIKLLCQIGSPVWFYFWSVIIMHSADSIHSRDDKYENRIEIDHILAEKWSVLVKCSRHVRDANISLADVENVINKPMVDKIAWNWPENVPIICFSLENS